MRDDLALLSGFGDDDVGGEGVSSEVDVAFCLEVLDEVERGDGQERDLGDERGGCAIAVEDAEAFGLG